MNLAYMEMLFSSALISQTVKAAAVDEDYNISVVFLNYNICAVQRFDEDNVYVELFIINHDSMEPFYSRFCHQKAEDAQYLSSLFASVLDYAELHCSYEDLENYNLDLKERVIKHRIEYL